MADDLGHRRVAVDALHELGAVRRVAAHHVPLLLGQRLLGEQDRVRERELADVVQQARRVRELLLPGGPVQRHRQRPRIAGDRRGVARGHPVAQRERLDHRGQHADLERGQALGTLLGQQQLPQQVLEDEEDDDEQRQRGEPAAGVHEGDEHAQQGADAGRRQDGDEDRPELVCQRAAGVEDVVARDPEEVEEVGDEEAGEDQQREGEGVLLQLERVGGAPDQRPPTSGKTA